MIKEIFTICDNAQSYGDKLIIVGPFTNINAPALPLAHPGFSIVVRLRYKPSESGEHKFTLTITDPDGINLINPLNANFNPQTISGEVGILNLNINMGQTIFNKTGEYTILLDGEGINEKLSFFVNIVP